jgi:hypothetical protein
MWRASGVKRLWHVHRDAFENLRDPFIPLMILSPKIEMLKTRRVVETVLRWWPRIMNVHEESCETRNWDGSRWLSGSCPPGKEGKGAVQEHTAFGSTIVL